MHDRPVALIVRAPGTNCDAELSRAFADAGARPVHVHIDRLAAAPAFLASADLVGFPGGFSFGDDIASGRVLAMKVRERLLGALAEAVARGVPIVGVCNGFQVLTQVGLLPGVDGSAARSAALAENAGARFIDAWVGVEYPQSRCIWTAGLQDVPAADAILPIAHGEGRLVADESTLDALEAGGQIAVRYTSNPNGSMRSIAGVCDPTGLVLGLMPHPERFADRRQHPSWTRPGAAGCDEPTPGARMFRNAVEHVSAARV